MRSGFNVAVPSTEDNSKSFGVLERMELDGNGHRAKYAWNPPVVVAVPGYIDSVSEGPTVPLGLARDAATGMWGIAYNQSLPDDNGAIMLATSMDGGVSWTSQGISGGAFGGDLYTPSLGLGNGQFFAVYLTDNTFFGSSANVFPQGSGCVYVSGKVADPPSN